MLEINEGVLDKLDTESKKKLINVVVMLGLTSKVNDTVNVNEDFLVTKFLVKMLSKLENGDISDKAKSRIGYNNEFKKLDELIQFIKNQEILEPYIEENQKQKKPESQNRNQSYRDLPAASKYSQYISRFKNGLNLQIVSNLTRLSSILSNS